MGKLRLITLLKAHRLLCKQPAIVFLTEYNSFTMSVILPYFPVNDYVDDDDDDDYDVFSESAESSTRKGKYN